MLIYQNKSLFSNPKMGAYPDRNTADLHQRQKHEAPDLKRKNFCLTSSPIFRQTHQQGEEETRISVFLMSKWVGRGHL